MTGAVDNASTSSRDRIRVSDACRTSTEPTPSASPLRSDVPDQVRRIGLRREHRGLDRPDAHQRCSAPERAFELVGHDVTEAFRDRGGDTDCLGWVLVEDGDVHQHAVGRRRSGDPLRQVLDISAELQLVDDGLQHAGTPDDLEVRRHLLLSGAVPLHDLRCVRSGLHRHEQFRFGSVQRRRQEGNPHPCPDPDARRDEDGEP
jgi:hypothetical protein